MSTTFERKSRTLGRLVLALIFVSLGWGCLARALNHDEEQFIAAGVLLAREGLLPYLHYPYFHLPNLVFVYAALFATNDFLLLTARSFNVLCACLLLVLLYAMTAARFAFLKEKRWLAAALVTSIFALNPIFQFTAGRAWNHDLAMLSCLAALACLFRSKRATAGGRCLFLSGALLGVAVGTRLTFLPFFAPFLILSAIFAGTAKISFRDALFFSAAFAIALLPTLVLCAAAPRAFLFDNFYSNGPLNIHFREATKPRNFLFDKLFFPIQQLKSPNTVAVVVAFGYFACWVPFREGWRHLARSPEILAWLLLAPVALVAGLAPTPSYHQYFYPLIPLMILGGAYGMARLR
ncbi:MAG: hypothetical protein M3Y86_12400, partial [Verrucomicrobiota bacterium]|nr:hypothetical protein [Verrucomicrobiota bacterium]